MKIGVVLSSGGGRGVYAHTGFLFALEKLGIEVAAVTGCSAGALAGGVFASGTDLRDWSKAIAEVKSQQFWTPDSWAKFFWEMVVNKGKGYTGLSDNKSAINFIGSNLSVQTFEECPIPFYSLAANLTQGSKTLFSSGDLAPRIMASAAMPALYRPVEVDGDLFCDGATIELSSTEAICCRHNLDALIVHHTATNREGPEGLDTALNNAWTLAEILNLLLYRNRPWYLGNQPIDYHHCRCGCGVPVIVVEPTLPELEWPLSKGGVDVQQAAEEQAEKLLAPYIDLLRNDPEKLSALAIKYQSQEENALKGHHVEKK